MVILGKYVRFQKCIGRVLSLLGNHGLKLVVYYEIYEYGHRTYVSNTIYIIYDYGSLRSKSCAKFVFCLGANRTNKLELMDGNSMGMTI